MYHQTISLLRDFSISVCLPPRFAATAVLIGATALAGCAHPEDRRWSGPDPVVEGYPKSPQNSKFVWQHTAAVAVYSFPVPAPASSTPLAIKELSDRAQAKLVEALLQSNASNEKNGADPATAQAAIRNAVSKPLTAKVTAAASYEGHYDRILVADVTEGVGFEPGDRLEWTWVEIIPDNFKFDNYTVATTDNELENVEQATSQTTAMGQAQATRGATITGSATSPAGAVGSSLASTIGLTGQLAHQYTTSATINQQYTKLNVDILPEELRVLRASERNLDAADNTVVALSLNADLELFRSVPKSSDSAGLRHSMQVVSISLTDKGKRRPPEKIEIAATINEAPPRCDLTATVSMIYRWRHIISGRQHFTEGKQRVVESIRRITQAGVVIVPADQTSKPTWTVYSETGHKQLTPAAILDLVGRQHDLEFLSYIDARNFADWLSWNLNWLRNTKKPKLGDSGLSLLAKSPIEGGGFDVARTPDDVSPAACAAIHYASYPPPHVVEDGAFYPNPVAKAARGHKRRNSRQNLYVRE